MLGLCLLAAFTLGAVAAASASAEGGPHGLAPGLYKCVKASPKGTGEYSEKECKTTSPGKTGGYNLQVVTSGAFAGKSKASTLTAHTTTGVAVTVACKKDTDHFEVVFENEVIEGKITFSDCTLKGTKTDCGNVGPETIETAPQEGELVWLNSAKTEAGVLLAGSKFAEFKCGTETVDVGGYVFGTSTIGGKKGPTFAFKTSGGKQALKSSFTTASFTANLTAGPHEEEATLESEEAQTGPGSLY